MSRKAKRNDVRVRMTSPARRSENPKLSTTDDSLIESGEEPRKSKEQWAEDWSDTNKLQRMSPLVPLVWFGIVFALLIVYGVLSS